MKKLIVIIAIVAILSSCSKTESKGDLNGNVKICFTKYFEPKKKFGEWDTTKLAYYPKSQKIEFDKNKKFQAVEYYRDDYKLSGKDIFKKNGEKITEESRYDEDGELEQRTTYEYSGDKLIKYLIYNEKNELIVDAKNNFISESVYENNYNDLKNNRKSIIKTFLKDGNPSISTSKDYWNGKFYSKDSTVYIYSNKGLLESVKIFREFATPLTPELGTKDTTILRNEYQTFDKKGNWTSMVSYSYYSTNRPRGEQPENFVTREIKYY